MNPIYTVFVYTVWFLSTYFVITFLLHLIKYKKKLFEEPKELTKNFPKVSILVPSYNEEKTIKATILSLKKIDYPKSKVEILIINDGSKDRTAKIAAKYHDGKHIIFVDNIKNKGKAACLNQGIDLATGDYIACMDADSMVKPNILKATIPHFAKKKIGVVTVTVEVNETKTFLQKVIDLEFILGLSLFLRVFSFLNCVFVTPGPFSIYRANLLRQIGGFDVNNITEDLEIAYRIHKAGYKIENTMKTKVVTDVPPTFKELHVQRKRWYSGAILTFWQHKNILFDKKVGLFKYFLPFNYSIIFLGIGLFLYSLFLTVKNALEYIWMYRFTGFNFFSNFELSIDPLNISVFTFFGYTGILLTLLFTVIGLRSAQKTIRKRLFGFFGYLFLFLLYQFFWMSSIYNVAMKKKIKWR
ncbi:hypothetical protein C0585_07385 [Candidatus Woesearchaeota archaeon]|nr:MAG: hypothetical protein C0585_07385 [Candidatus Woesearchaeota archaeon]